MNPTLAIFLICLFVVSPVLVIGYLLGVADPILPRHLKFDYYYGGKTACRLCLRSVSSYDIDSCDISSCDLKGRL